MSEQEPKSEEQVEDLDVPESESEDVQGGLSLNYSKIEIDRLGTSQKISPNIGSNIKQFGDGSV
jgi:hypothetical protein